MRKIGIGIGFILIILFCCTAKCQAQQTGSFVLTSETETVEVGKEIAIGITLQGARTMAYEATLYWDTTKLELLSQDENTNAEENRILVVWYDQTGGTEPKTGELVRFRFRTKEVGNANFIAQGKWYDEAENEKQEWTEEKKIQITEKESALVVEPEEENTQREDNTNLENLAMEDVLLYPPFEARETNYTAEVGNAIETVKILAIPEQESAIAEIVGNEGLQEGDNTISIRVTAPSGAKKEYTIRVYKRNAEEERIYKEEQEQMPEKVKQAYEIEKLSMTQEVPPIEEKVEEVVERKQWEGVVILVIGIGLGVVWYTLERRKKKRKNEKFSKKA